MLNHNNGDIAIRKILKYHKKFDMSPLFEWDWKLLPRVITWFDLAKVRIQPWFDLAVTRSRRSRNKKTYWHMQSGCHISAHTWDAWHIGVMYWEWNDKQVPQMYYNTRVILVVSWILSLINVWDVKLQIVFKCFFLIGATIWLYPHKLPLEQCNVWCVILPIYGHLPNLVAFPHQKKTTWE